MKLSAFIQILKLVVITVFWVTAMFSEDPAIREWFDSPATEMSIGHLFLIVLLILVVLSPNDR